MLQILPTASSPGACCLSDIGWRLTWWRWWPCSPSSDITKTTWLREKVASKNIHKNTGLIPLVFNLETEMHLRIKVLPNLLSWFHHTLKCVKTLHLQQHTILKLVNTMDIEGKIWEKWIHAHDCKKKTSSFNFWIKKSTEITENIFDMKWSLKKPFLKKKKVIAQ